MKRLAARSREIPESVVIIVWLLSQNLIKNGNLFDCFSIIFFWSQRWSMSQTTNICGIIIDWLRLQLSARGTIWVYSFRGMTPFGICAVKESFTIAFCCSFEWTQWKYASNCGRRGGVVVDCLWEFDSFLQSTEGWCILQNWANRLKIRSRAGKISRFYG